MVELPGLVSSSPVCAMAAMGLLRVLAEDRGLPVTLGWRRGLACIGGIDFNLAVGELAQSMQGRSEAFEWNWSETTRKIAPDAYRAASEQAMEAGDQRGVDFLAAFGTDAVLRDGSITPTSMDMTSGRQRLIKDLKNLAAKLQDKPD